MSPAPQPFQVDLFLRLLHARSLSWGTPLRYCEQTGSTNDDALQAARQGAQSGSLFVAEHQTKGRGRAGKRWLGDPGKSLLFSILLRPEAEQLQPPLLTLCAGLAVRAAGANHLPVGHSSQLQLKWPNDVVTIQTPETATNPVRCKLAGVLCEGQLSGATWDAIVIGVGLNVFDQALPDTLDAPAISMSQLGANSQLSREALLIDVLDEMHKRISLNTSHHSSALLHEFRQHDALLGTQIRVSTAANSDLHGIARGIDAEGRLLLETPQGIVPIVSGTIRSAP